MIICVTKYYTNQNSNHFFDFYNKLFEYAFSSRLTSHFLCQKFLFNMVEYNIGTCYGCCRCLYCGYNPRVKKCECDKTVKPIKANRTENVPYAFTRIFGEKMNIHKKTFIQTKNTLHSYGSNLEKRFTFALCSACNSQFQRLTDKKTTETSASKSFNGSNFHDKKPIEPLIIIDEFISSQPSVNEKNEKMQEQQVSFTLIVKKADGKLFPGKWLAFDTSSFKKFTTQVQKCIRTTVEVDDVDQKEYSLAFKSAKSNGGSLELSDSNDFEKFLDEYEKLLRLQKEIVVIAQMKQKICKKKKRKQIEVKIYFFLFICFIIM